MEPRTKALILAAVAIVLAVSASAADKSSVHKPIGSTAPKSAAPLDTRALNKMLRADRDKDGTLSREELEHYDMSLARRFKDVDADRDGKLTFNEFEKLLMPQDGPAQRDAAQAGNPPGAVGATR